MVIATAYEGVYVLRDTNGGPTWVYGADQDQPVPGAVTSCAGVNPEGILAPELMPCNLMTMMDLADYLNISYGTVRNYRSSGKLVAPVGVLDNTPFWTRPVVDIRRFGPSSSQQQLPL